MEPEKKEQIDSGMMQKQTKVEADYQAALTRWKKLLARVDEAGKLQAQTMFPLDPSRKARFQRLKDQLADAQSQLDEAFKRRVEQGSSSLASILTFVEKDEAKSHELQKLATELNQKFSEVEDLLREVEKKTPQPSTPPVIQDAVGDVDVEPPSTSLKRRRLSVGYEDTTSTPAVAPMKKEIKDLYAILKEVSERVSNVENSQAAQEGEMREVMQAYLHDRAAEGGPSANTVDARVNRIHEQTKNIESELSELSTWVDEARAANARTEDEQKLLIEEKNKEEADLRDLLARVEKHEKNQTKDKNEIEALSAALSAYSEKPVSPPSSPFDPETIVSDMEDQIKALVRHAIKPHIDESRSAVSEDLRNHDSELFTTLWSKLSLTRKVIAAVTEATKQPPAS